MGSGGGIRARAQVLAVCRQSTTKNWTRAKSRAHGSFLRILCKGMSLSHGNSYMMTLTLVQSDKTYPYVRGLSQGVKKKSGSNRSSCGASIRYGGEWPLYPHAQGRSNHASCFSLYAVLYHYFNPRHQAVGVDLDYLSATPQQRSIFMFISHHLKVS